MYQFHYDVMKPYYGDRAKLLYTDTDSLVYDIQTEDIFKDMLERNEYYDFSNFKSDHPIFNELSEEEKKNLQEKNDAIPCKYKDELEGNVIKEFAAVKPKMYSYIMKGKDKDEQKAKAKGITEAARKKDMKHEKYVNAINKPTVEKTSFNSIQSKEHQLETKQVNKISLTSIDDKRYYIDSNNSRAHGHHLNNQE